MTLEDIIDLKLLEDIIDLKLFNTNPYDVTLSDFSDGKEVFFVIFKDSLEDYGYYGWEYSMLENFLNKPIDDMPLYIKGSPPVRALAWYRLQVNK